MTRRDDGIGHKENFPTAKPLEGTALAERYQRAKAALGNADPFYAREAFWKGFEAAGPATYLNESQVNKLEQMTESYKQRPAPEMAPQPMDPIGQMLEEYDTGEIETVEDLANRAEILAMKTDNELLGGAVRSFRKWQGEDWELAGRGDSDEAEATLLAGIKRARSAFLSDLK